MLTCLRCSSFSLLFFRLTSSSGFVCWSASARIDVSNTVGEESRVSAPAHISHECRCPWHVFQRKTMSLRQLTRRNSKLTGLQSDVSAVSSYCRLSPGPLRTFRSDNSNWLLPCRFGTGYPRETRETWMRGIHCHITCPQLPAKIWPCRFDHFPFKSKFRTLRTYFQYSKLNGNFEPLKTIVSPISILLNVLLPFIMLHNEDPPIVTPSTLGNELPNPPKLATIITRRIYPISKI